MKLSERNSQSWGAELSAPQLCSPCLPFILLLLLLCSMARWRAAPRCWVTPGELMKTNDCHYRHFTSHHTGSITKPDMAFPSWPQRRRVKTLHLCFHFFFLWDCDSVTCRSTVPRGIMCQIRQSIAQCFQDYRGGGDISHRIHQGEKREVFYSRMFYNKAFLSDMIKLLLFAATVTFWLWDNFFATDKLSHPLQESKCFRCFVVQMQLALLWCCTDPASSLPGPPTIFFQLHIHEIFYILSRDQSKHSLLWLRALTEWKDLETHRFSSPEARRFLHTVKYVHLWCGSADSCSASSRSFHVDFRPLLHPRPLLTTQQGQRLCHRCVIAGFCLCCGITEERKEATLLAN